MAAPLELSCWGGGWGLPSVHSESLVVMVRPLLGPGAGRKGRGQRRGAGQAGRRRPGAVPCGLRRAGRWTALGSCSRVTPGLWPHRGVAGGLPLFLLAPELFSSLQSYLGGGVRARSGARAASSPAPLVPAGSFGKEPGSRKPGSGARAPWARDRGRDAPPCPEVRSSEPGCEVKQLCRFALRTQSKMFHCKLCFRLTPNFLAHPWKSVS